ncbi:hypothetical protein [Xenorhabdus sp. IM139775]
MGTGLNMVLRHLKSADQNR